MRAKPVRLSKQEAEPCPFCGRQPEIEPWHGGAPTKVMIACTEQYGECPAPQVTGETREEGLALWNMRKGQ